MDFNYSALKELPSPFYRVSIKAIVFDGNNRLLVGKEPGGTWEIPGGGFEHNESIAQCLNRELLEEIGIGLASLGRIVCVYRGVNKRGFISLKIALQAHLVSYDFRYRDLLDAQFVTKEELSGLDMGDDENGIKDCVDLIWPPRT
jgi:8-oxo-dGTP pyrophosphatase MutT (NUDIX family)